MSVTIAVRGLKDGPELNVANRNFSMIWSALGFEVEWVGSMDGRCLSRAVKNTDMELLLRAGHESGGPGTGQVHWVERGVDVARASNYLIMLLSICRVAEKAESPVDWG